MKFHLVYLLSAFLILFVSNVYPSSEENDIDVNNHNHYHNRNNHRTHRHRNVRLRHKYGKRMHRNRGLKIRTTHASFIHNYDDYDVRINDRVTFNVTAKVGDSVILNCAINSSYGINPGVIWIQGKQGNVLTLNRDRVTVDNRFEIIQTPLQQKNQIIEKETNHNKRDNKQPQQNKFDLNYYHLKINNVQAYDENEYSCETTVSHHNDNRPNLQSLVHLKVTQSPNFIESLTSKSNIAVKENTNVVLECNAVGKPKPRISWFKVKENGFTIDLQNHRNKLFIKNISRSDLSKYECVAENGILPSVSKKFSLNINFAPIVISIKPIIYQKPGESVLIGCRINSNPDSSVKWYKRKLTTLNNSMKEYDQYEEIDFNLNQNYQNLNFKQTNQTVSYFKIKYLHTKDYTKFKCLASNIAGIGESVIEVKDLALRKTSELRMNNSAITVKAFSIQSAVIIIVSIFLIHSKSF